MITPIVLGVLASANVDLAVARNPSQAQIQKAVRRAEHSTQLWATVNVCNSHRYPNYLGVRGQMPALGFAAWLSMDIRLYYYARGKHRFLPVLSHGTKLVRLGREAKGLQQGGVLFQFAPHQPRLEAVVRFVWRRSGHVLGHTSRATTASHPSADYGSPRHYSAAVCKIR